MASPISRTSSFPYADEAQALAQAGMSQSFAGLYVEMTRAFNEGKVKPQRGRTTREHHPHAVRGLRPRVGSRLRGYVRKGESDFMSKYAGKKAVVTGGTAGIGLATEKALLEEGVEVLLTGRNKQTLEATQRELGPRAHVVRSETASLADIEALGDCRGKRSSGSGGLRVHQCWLCRTLHPVSEGGNRGLCSTKHSASIRKGAYCYR